LELDILNILYDVCESMLSMGKSTGDAENLRMNIFTTLGVDYPISESDFKSKEAPKLTQELYGLLHLKAIQRKNDLNSSETAFPILKRVHDERGATVKDIMVPISDGIKANRRSLQS
jgi:preprotein translocase subunit SecA